MDVFLGKVTQHAMNYAIRSGVGITASFAIGQTSRLLKAEFPTVDNNADYHELQTLQERLDGKIKIISPAIDLIELISARGNTTLESAVTLTKTLRRDIQNLGVRLEKAASAEESSRREKNRAKSKGAHEVEIREIVLDIRKLLTRIEDAVPLINLAITTSGASLSTTLPASVSPSRLLQASTFLTAGDTQYSLGSSQSVQVGPTFTLSLYMLFSAGFNPEKEAKSSNIETDSARETTWKEAIHKARVKLMRVPLPKETLSSPAIESVESHEKATITAQEGKGHEFAYRIEVIEDLDDDRVHSFEDDEAQPGEYGDVQLAGIREFLPIHQISKIFYADTGKILNIGDQGEANSPVLLLKRDINAVPPCRMMQENEIVNDNYEQTDGLGPSKSAEVDYDSQEDIDQQLRRESSINTSARSTEETLPPIGTWKLPQDLDPEWLALEVYTEPETSSSEDGQEIDDDSAYASHRPRSSEQQNEADLATDLAHLKLGSPPSSSPTHQVDGSYETSDASPPKPSPFGPIRTSLSLLEMLIRLTALQQFQQASHLSIPDELLSFFLEESSTTGAGPDGEARRRTRREARRKVGFDPYDESPVKRHGEDYQYQNQNQDWDRAGTPFDEYAGEEYPSPLRPRWQRERSTTPQGSTDSWLRNRDISGSPRQNLPGGLPSSPVSPFRPPKKTSGPLDRVQKERGAAKVGSPLGRGMSVETDSSLGTSPGSPNVVHRSEKRDM